MIHTAAIRRAPQRQGLPRMRYAARIVRKPASARGSIALLTLCLLAGCARAASAQQDEHAGHAHPASGAPAPPPAQPPGELPPFIPPVTDADREAAFAEVGDHAHSADRIYSFVLVDQLEWQAGDGTRTVNLDSHGWVGWDRDRLWFRVEGDGGTKSLHAGHAHALYGRQVSRWWDVVVGVRQDVRPGPAQTWAAFGVQGLAPYWFDVEATAYIGATGRTQARFKAEYDLRFTNRLVLQPLVQVDVAGTADPAREIGAGLSETETGVRLRYEIRRELAPYIGVTWNRAWGKTADFARAGGERVDGGRLVTGVRLWF
jgi:copper resistance protein B